MLHASSLARWHRASVTEKFVDIDDEVLEDDVVPGTK
jgi:hypothetical protein